MKVTRWLLLFGLAASPALAEEAPVIAVFNIEDTRAPKQRLSQADLVALTDYLANKVSGTGVFQRIADSELKQALVEKKKSSYDACYESACQIEIGKELAAQKTLATKISSLGKTCYVASTLWDLKRATSERTADEEGACDIDAIRAALKKIASMLVEVRAKTPEVAAPSAPNIPPVVQSGLEHGKTYQFWGWSIWLRPPTAGYQSPDAYFWRANAEPAAEIIGDANGWWRLRKAGFMRTVDTFFDENGQEFYEEPWTKESPVQKISGCDHTLRGSPQNPSSVTTVRCEGDTIVVTLPDKGRLELYSSGSITFVNYQGKARTY